jgi:hypothetical protein
MRDEYMDAYYKFACPDWNINHDGREGLRVVRVKSQDAQYVIPVPINIRGLY